MPRCLFVVEDVLAIKGRGLILVPGIVPEGDEVFRVGDAIELRRHDGQILSAQIAGLDIHPGQRGEIAIMVPVRLSKADVPVGTEVWSVK